MLYKLYTSIIEKKRAKKKQFAVLIDPDKISAHTVKIAALSGVDYFFVGGSLVISNTLNKCIEMIKNETTIPVVLFPGSILQINKKADALLLLSLISGRNPDLLIGKHVIAAPTLKASKLELISTGYMLIESGKQTTASYISNTPPIPSDKTEIAMCTAMAGEMLGLKTIYMDAGSGALNAISTAMIEKVANNISIPLIVGGGIKTVEQAIATAKAGADVVVIGNAIENDKTLIASVSDAIHNL